MAPLQLINSMIEEARSVDWSLVRYRQASFVFFAAELLLAAIFIRYTVRWWRWWHNKPGEKSYYLHSGRVFHKHDKPGITTRLVRLVTYAVLAIGVLFLMTALADPYLVIGSRNEYFEPREIVYIRDVSASMGFRFHKTKLSRAEITQMTLMNLIAKRRGKGDQSAYIIFSSESQIWSYFTGSTDSMLFTAGMAPWVLASSDEFKAWPEFFIFKDFTVEEKSSGTNLHLGLQSAVYLFDKKGSPKITEAMKDNPGLQMRSVIIITDGAADQDPEPEFKELKKRHIVPYLVYIDPEHLPEVKIYGTDSPKTKLPGTLLSLVHRYGGETFLASDEASVERISQAIDKLNTVRTEVRVKSEEKDIHHIPLALACLFLVVGVLLRSVLFNFLHVA